MTTNTSPSASLIQRSSEVLLFVAGLIYATGFLIVFTFLSTRFALRAADIEFFKARYLYVGGLYTLFEVLIIFPMLCFGIVLRGQYRKRLAALTAPSNTKTESDGDQAPTLYAPSIYLVLNMMLVFYVYIAFASPGFGDDHHWLVTALFVGTVAIAVALRGIHDLIASGWMARPGGMQPVESKAATKIAKQRAAMFYEIAGWLALGVAAVVDFVGLRDLSGVLGAMLWAGGWHFLLLQAVLWFLAWRQLDSPVRIRDLTLQVPFAGLRASTVIALYYVSIVSFAVRVYPFIPAVKGGGDYSRTTLAVLQMQGPSNELLPVRIGNTRCATSHFSRPVIIVEDTEKSLFVVNPTEAGGPLEWSANNRPAVIEIQRARVENIEYSQQMEVPRGVTEFTSWFPDNGCANLPKQGSAECSAASTSDTTTTHARKEHTDLAAGRRRGGR